VIGSDLTQIIKDSGKIADLLGGFQGRASGIGALALYIAKLEKPGVVVQLRWVNEFKVTKPAEG
jgi:hypothetical protein